MEENLLDKHFRDKLGTYASPVPEGMWERIANETKRKPKIIWWNNKYLLILVVLILAGSLLGLQLLRNNVPSTTENDLLSKTDKVEKKSKDNSSKSTDVVTVEPSKERALISESSVNDNLASSVETDNQNKSKQTISQSNTLTNPIHHIQNSQVQRKSSKTSNNSSKRNLNEESNVNNESASFIENIMETGKKNANSESVFSADVEELYKYSFSKGTHVFLALKKDYGMINANLNAASYFTRDCPTVYKKKRSDSYLEAYVAPEYTMKSVTTNDINNSTYLQLKDSSEKMYGGISAGIRFTKSLNKNLLLKAGLQFSQVNERLNLRTENDKKTITVVTIKTVTDASGNTVSVSDTSSYVQIGYKVINSYNFYRNIELPLMASYELNLEKSKLAINGGVLVNLASWYKGTVVSPTYQLVSVSSKENREVYENKVGVSIIGGLSWIKPINNRLDFFAEPYFRFNLSKGQYNSYGFNQRFSALGLSLGLRYNLNYYRQHYY